MNVYQDIAVFILPAHLSCGHYLIEIQTKREPMARTNYSFEKRQKEIAKKKKKEEKRLKKMGNGAEEDQAPVTESKDTAK